jgi:hypothetical protein
MRIRTLVAVVAVALAGVGATTTAVLAGSAGGSSPVNCQSDVLTGTAVHTASTTYTPIQALSASVAAIYPISITVSADVSGAPMAFEMQDTWAGGIVADAPGPAFVSPPGGAATSFSFTWVAPNNAAAERGHSLSLVWKRNSPAGTSTLLGGDMVVTYHTNGCSGAV